MTTVERIKLVQALVNDTAESVNAYKPCIDRGLHTRNSIDKRIDTIRAELLQLKKDLHGWK